MRTAQQIHSAYQGRHGWRGNDYVDLEGFTYENWARNSSGCSECLFCTRMGHKSETESEKGVRSGQCCIVYHEKGMSPKDQGKRTGFELKSPRDCTYYFKKDFSEGDSEDEKLQNEVEKIAQANGFSYGRSSSTSSSSGNTKKSGFPFVWVAIGLVVLYLIFG